MKPTLLHSQLLALLAQGHHVTPSQAAAQLAADQRRRIPESSVRAALEALAGRSCAIAETEGDVTRYRAHPYAGIPNRTMAALLGRGEALDVRAIGAPIADWPGHYLLRSYTSGVDYCDPQADRWVWSIGVENVTPACGFHPEGPEAATGAQKCEGTGCHGRIVASLEGDLYSGGQDPTWHCIWLR